MRMILEAPFQISETHWFLYQSICNFYFYAGACFGVLFFVVVQIGKKCPFASFRKRLSGHLIKLNAT